MEFKGTKGKWSYSKFALDGLYPACEIPISSDIGVIELATVWSNGEEDIIAQSNALLISKAPEMLEFISKIYNQWRETGISSVTFDDHMKNAELLIKEATEL